jgi:DNA-binding transcriptional regulator YhcF (GntR family)
MKFQLETREMYQQTLKQVIRDLREQGWSDRQIMEWVSESEGSLNEEKASAPEKKSPKRPT